MEPRGNFSMAVPAEVLAAALAEDGSRRSRPGAVPDYWSIASRSMVGVMVGVCCTRKTDLLLSESLLAYGRGGL